MKFSKNEISEALRDYDVSETEKKAGNLLKDFSFEKFLEDVLEGVCYLGCVKKEDCRFLYVVRTFFDEFVITEQIEDESGNILSEVYHERKSVCLFEDIYDYIGFLERLLDDWAETKNDTRKV